QAAQRLIEVMGDLASAERSFPARAAVRIADLGRNLRVVHEGSALRPEPLAEHDLARSAAVGVCSVEPAQADAAGMIEQLQRLGFAVAGAAQVGRRADSAEVAAAEDDAGDVARVQHRGPSTSYAGPPPLQMQGRIILANPRPA